MFQEPVWPIGLQGPHGQAWVGAPEIRLDECRHFHQEPLPRLFGILPEEVFGRAQELQGSPQPRGKEVFEGGLQDGDTQRELQSRTV